MQENFRLIWERIAAAIRPQVGLDTYQRWFAAIVLVQADEQCLTLRVPNNIYQLWIESNYMPLVQQAIMAVLGAPRQLRFAFQEEVDSPVSALVGGAAGHGEPPAEGSLPPAASLTALGDAKPGTSGELLRR